MAPRSGRLGFVAALALFLACAKAPLPAPPPPPPRPVAPIPTSWPYWQAPVVELRPSAEPVGANPDPLPPTWLVSDAVWRASSGAILAKVHEDGLAVRRTKNAETGVGAFYEDRARRDAPLLITADSLFAIAHLALASVAADVEQRVMKDELSTVLHRLDARLRAEAGRARPDLLEGYRIARTTVAVALALSEPAYVVPVELAEAVAGETALIHAHAGLAHSPLFEMPFDYGALSPRGSISSPTDPGAGAFLAAEWLGTAPFFFEGEGQGAEVDVGAARSQTRGALLLARLLVKEGDSAASAAAAHLAVVDRFSLGDSDDLSPVDVAGLAGRSGIDLGGGSDIASVAKLDRFRHQASGRASRSNDGGTARDAPWASLRSMRLVPLRAPPDNRVLSALVSPYVGGLELSDAGPGVLARERRSPSALDVGAWLGSSAAKAALASRGDSGYAGFDRALERLIDERPADSLARHSSVYASFLEAIATWLRPSAGRPLASGGAEGRRKLQTALVAWTFLRHDALAFAHERPRAPLHAPEPRTGPSRVFVEPHPEAIASLLGALRQLRVGLRALGGLRDDFPSAPALAETESLLALALDASVLTANLDPSIAELEPELARMPARMAALEAAQGPGAEPVVIDVHVDMGSGRVLEEGTEPLEEMFLWVRDSTTHRPVLAVGAVIPHVELVESGWTRLGDEAWRALVAAGGMPLCDPRSELEPVAPDGSLVE
jgi:hypothetical protein